MIILRNDVGSIDEDWCHVRHYFRCAFVHEGTQARNNLSSRHAEDISHSPNMECGWPVKPMDMQYHVSNILGSCGSRLGNIVHV